MTRRFASDRRTRPWLAAMGVGVCLLAWSARAEAQIAAEVEPVPAATTQAPDPLIDSAAVEPVKRMVRTLADAKSLSYQYESSYDALQADGEILEFGSRGAATLRRPDRYRGETWERGGRHLRWAWDGKEITVYDEQHNAYATTPRTGDIDSLVDFLRDDIGLRLPLADLFTADLGPLLVERVVAARTVGKETLRGVECEHVALRSRTGVDMQFWIRTGEHAFPERIVLNFSTADGRPQFRSDFHDWELNPRARDSSFELEAPKGAKQVPFLKQPRRAAEADAQGATQ